MTEDQAKQIKGLSRAEVLEKLKQEGYNELPSSKKRNILAIAFEVVKEPMFLLLVAVWQHLSFPWRTKGCLVTAGFRVHHDRDYNLSGGQDGESP